jgi:hypothetical protein
MSVWFAVIVTKIAARNRLNRDSEQTDSELASVVLMSVLILMILLLMKIE